MDVKALRYAALTMMLLSAGGALAQTSVADLDRIQADTLRLRAQAAKAQAVKDLADLREAARPGEGSAGRDGLPVARGVFGANGERYVSFLYAGGGTAEARQGERIPGDYIVRSFDTSGVVLAKGGRTHRIPFAIQAPTPTPAAPAPGTGHTYGHAIGPAGPLPPMP